MSQLPTDNSTGYGDLPYVMSGLGRRRNPYDQRRQMALGMMQGGMDASPVAHPLQGASRLAQALVGSLMMGKADSDEQAADKARQDEFGRIAGIADPQERLAALGKIDPEAGARYAGQVAMQEIAAKRNADMFQQGGSQIAAGYGMAPSGGGPTGPQQAAMPPEQAKATAQQYVQYLVQNHGFKPEEAAQMVGNLYQESGFNPTALHDNGTGFGLGGWRLDRRDALLKSAQEQGRDPRDPQFQLDFYANELKSRPEYAQLQQAQTPEARQAALMTYFRPAGWTPQAPQNGHGFGARVQYGQTFAGGGAPSPQGQLPIPQPPGAAPQGMPAPPDVPRPQPTPELLARAEQMYKAQMFGKDPQAALAGARQWVEQQLENQWTRDREVANRTWQVQREDRKDQAQIDRIAPEAFIKGAAENYSKNVRPKAENAVSDIAGIHQIRQLLDAGAFTGVGAEAKTYAAKLGELVGLAPSEAAANTQVLGAQLANRVIAGMGGSLGAGFSNADRDFVEKAKSGQISMTEPALRRLMDLGERQARQTLDAHAREVERFSKVPELSRMTGGQFFALPPAPSYQEWSKANPLQPVTPQGASPQQGQQMPTINSPDEAARLPKGTRFRDPQGNVRVVP